MTEQTDLTNKDVIADNQGVDRVCEAMLEKLETKRNEGYGGWHDPEQCSVAFLAEAV